MASIADLAGQALTEAVSRLSGSPRQGQTTMVERVAATIEDGGHLLVQAGTGRDWSGWFAWIGAESLATRRAKGVLKREHGLGKAALHAQAYWMRGRALGKSRLLDELNAAHEAE
mgnify:CR=1 FL=1